MPIVTVTVVPHPHRRDLLAAVADGVAAALALGPGDVLATALDAQGWVASGQHGDDDGDRDWVVVSIHGSDRGEAATAAARSAAAEAVTAWGEQHHLDLEGVWTEWVLPTPPAPASAS
jgi:hypothetical protein